MENFVFVAHIEKNPGGMKMHAIEKKVLYIFLPLLINSTIKTLS